MEVVSRDTFAIVNWQRACGPHKEIDLRVEELPASVTPTIKQIQDIKESLQGPIAPRLQLLQRVLKPAPHNKNPLLPRITKLLMEQDNLTKTEITWHEIGDWRFGWNH